MQKAIGLILGLFLCISSFLRADVLKVLPVMNFCFKESGRVFVNNFMPLLKKNGIIFVDTNPDLVLICGRGNLKLCKKFKKKPIVILDETESASLGPNLRQCLKNNNVGAVIKNTTLRPKEKNNESTGLGGTYHFKLINANCRKFELKKTMRLTSKELQKIQCALWDVKCSAFRRDLEAQKNELVDFDKERPVDVFFAGTVNRRRPPGRHRQLALNMLKNVQGRNVVIHEGRLPKDKYFTLLKNSKIAVSPWGNGEWCWRDFEAIYSGALVIKPDTSFVQAVPDLYQNNRYYVPCKADFSDLEEKITYVLNNYSDFTEMRNRAKELLVDNWNYEMHAKKLASVLKKAFKEGKRVNGRGVKGRKVKA